MADKKKKIIEIIAKSIGIESDENSIGKAVYKATNCGAWVKFNVDGGLSVGTIVEGCEAEYSEEIELTDDPKELCARFWMALARCDEFASDIYSEELQTT